MATWPPDSRDGLVNSGWCLGKQGIIRIHGMWIVYKVCTDKNQGMKVGWKEWILNSNPAVTFIYVVGVLKCFTLVSHRVMTNETMMTRTRTMRAGLNGCTYNWTAIQCFS